MKKLFLILSVALFSLGTVNAFAQEAEAVAAAEQTEAVADEAVAEAETAVAAETEIAGESMHHILMQKFLEGGWGWMLPVLLCLVIGLAVAIERILFLSLSTINSKKFIAPLRRLSGTAASKLPRTFAATRAVPSLRSTTRVSTATTRVSTP